jgi:hypothetical protein
MSPRSNCLLLLPQYSGHMLSEWACTLVGAMFTATALAALVASLFTARTTPEVTMVRKILALTLLAMSLAPPGIHAQTAPAGASPPAANAVDPAAIKALKDMGAYLQTLKRFRVSSEVTGERVLADGQKLQHSASADLDVARPNKLRAWMSSARAERELTYDGKTVTLYMPAQKYYSTIAFDGTLGALFDRLEQKYAVQLPLSDLFVFGTPAAQFDKVESAMNAGRDLVGKDLCDHYAFRSGMIDWQIWITTGKKPLPRKIVITNRADEARPQSVTLIDWDLKAPPNDAVFQFMPPKGASRIAIAPRKTQ